MKVWAIKDLQPIGLSILCHLMIDSRNKRPMPDKAMDQEINTDGDGDGDRTGFFTNTNIAAVVGTAVVGGFAYHHRNGIKRAGYATMREAGKAR